jgi:hypothetical protein
MWIDKENDLQILNLQNSSYRVNQTLDKAFKDFLSVMIKTIKERFQTFTFANGHYLSIFSNDSCGGKKRRWFNSIDASIIY